MDLYCYSLCVIRKPLLKTCRKLTLQRNGSLTSPLNSYLGLHMGIRLSKQQKSPAPSKVGMNPIFLDLIEIWNWTWIHAYKIQYILIPNPIFKCSNLRIGIQDNCIHILKVYRGFKSLNNSLIFIFESLLGFNNIPLIVSLVYLKKISSFI